MTQHTSPVDVLVVEDLAQQRLPARGLVAVLRQHGLSARLRWIHCYYCAAMQQELKFHGVNFGPFVPFLKPPEQVF